MCMHAHIHKETEQDRQRERQRDTQISSIPPANRIGPRDTLMLLR